VSVTLPVHDELFRAVVDCALDAIVTKSVDGIVATWNAGAQRLFGYAAEEMIGQPITKLFPPERLHEEDALLARIRQGEPVTHFETVRVCKDGRRIDVSVSLSPIRYAGGQIIGASKIARDITEWRNTSARLEILQRLTAALNAAGTPDDIAHLAMKHAVDAFGAEVATFTMLSQDGREILTDHTLGIPIDDLVSLRRLPITADISAALAIRGGKPVVATSQFLRDRVTSRHWVNPYRGGTRVSVPVMWESHAIASLNLGFAAWCDISKADLAFMETIANQCAQALQRARAYASEQAARTAAERNAHLREEMLAIVSHDLRNPLAMVVLAASHLASQQHSELTPSLLQKVVTSLQRSAQQMTRLIDDLLDLSSIDAGVFRVEMRGHVLADVIDESLTMVRPLAAEQNIRLHASVPAGATVHCDAARTVQVLGNLLSNAIKVTSPDSEVHIECVVEDGLVRIGVTDSGPGIAADDLPRLFDRYWRGPQRKYRGAGLGLAIAKGIVDAQGGRIWVASTVGRGSTFYFTIPAP